MGFTNDLIKKTSDNLRFMQNNLIVTMHELNKQIGEANDDYSKRTLEEYKKEIWNIAHHMGIVVDMIFLDDAVDLPAGFESRGSVDRK